MPNIRIVLVIFLGIVSSLVSAQQKSDKGYSPSITTPSITGVSAPRIMIDEKHRNGHTRKGKFLGFSRLLEANGYTLESGKKSFNPSLLNEVDVLVVANAKRSSKRTVSAFNETEIGVLTEWVKAGGSLLLIADHSPYPAFASNLASAFGFKLINGIAYGSKKQKGRYRFEAVKGSLDASSFLYIDPTLGEKATFMTFTGSAFVPPSGATNVLKFGADSWVALVQDGDFKAVKTAKKYPINGLSQGALLKFGDGKVALFGEAAAFTAQKNGKRKMGLHAPGAEGNEAFVLALMRWLTSKNRNSLG